MKYEDALKVIVGAESVGGQLIVTRDGRHILVGVDVQGTLIVAETEEAKMVMAEVEGSVHALVLDDKVDMGDRPGARPDNTLPTPPPTAGNELPTPPPTAGNELPTPPPTAGNELPPEPAPEPKTKR